MKLLLSSVVVLALVWLFLIRPDQIAETEKVRQQLAFEADSLSQALKLEMEKYRLASVLLTQTANINAALTSNATRGEDSAQVLDRISYLQALSGVNALAILRRGESVSLPALALPPALLQSGHWQNGVQRAFHGSLGRAYFSDPEGRPHYLFFTPVFSEGGGAPQAILIALIDLGPIRDRWESSAHRVALWSDDGELLFDNRITAPGNPISIAREHRQLDAVLRVTGSAPDFFGPGMLRGFIAALCLLLGVVLLLKQSERRRLLAELAEQRAGEAARLEREINQRTHELSIAQNQLVMTEKMALLGQMSASISHEINQPLAAIKNYASASLRLMKAGNTTAVSDNLNTVESLTERISRIVVHLRSFAQQEPSTVKPVSIGPVVGKAVSEFLDRFPSAADVLHYAPPAHPIWVQAGEIRLLQVLGNLLSNAHDACQAADNTPPSITITIADGDDHVCVSVIDTGPGIDNAIADTLFDAFVSNRAASDGMGLGLTISRSFVESMGGTLTINAKHPGGTRFDIVLKTLSSPSA